MEKNKNIIAKIIILLILSVPFFIGINNNITINIICIILFILLAFTFKILPNILICLFTSVLLFTFKCVPTINEAFYGFSNNIIYFIIVSFGFATAIKNTKLSKWLLIKIIKVSRKSFSGILFSFMLSCFIFSSFISNVVAVLIFLPLAELFCDTIKNAKDREKIKKILYIALPISSMLGGIMTPAGSSINLITIDLMSTLGKINITFLQWIIWGMPTAIILFFISYLLINKIYKTSKINININTFINLLKENITLDLKEKKLIAILLVTIVCWILSTWFSFLNITAIAIVSIILITLPSLNIVSWDKVLKDVKWDAVFITATMITVSYVININGINTYIADIFTNIPSISIYVILMIICLLVFVILALVPTGPAAVAILIPLLITFAKTADINVIPLCFICSFCSCLGFLLPFETVMSIPYSYNNFKIRDLLKVSLPLQMVIALTLPLLIIVIDLIF